MKIGACAVLAMVWASCYSFELFPWSGDMEWWYLPHLATLLAANWIVLVWAVARAVDGTFGNRVPSGTNNPPTEGQCQRPSPTLPAAEPDANSGKVKADQAQHVKRNVSG